MPPLLSTDFNKVLNHKALIVQTAKNSIQSGFSQTEPSLPALVDCPTILQNNGSSFVTITKNEKLRGCIGSLNFSRPLIHDVALNAYAAAFKDRRFPALERTEYQHILVEISLLSPLVPLSFVSEEDLKSKINAGEDGLVLSDGQRCATFIPAVWDQVEDVNEFVKYLKMKMGRPPQYWSDEITAEKFHVLKITEQ